MIVGVLLVLFVGLIVAYRACVTRSFDESKILIGGVGGRILKHNVEWVH